MKKRTSFIKFIQFWGLFFLVGIGVSVIAIDVISSYRYFDFHANQIRSEYINGQKQMVKQEVARVVDLISHEKAQSEILTKNKIKSRVYEAYSIAQNIYKQNNATKSKSEIEQMIKDALRPIQFEQESGYYFITRLDGVDVLFADKPEMEGLNLLNVQDLQGRYVVKDMIKIAKESGQGFYEYYWSKPEAKGNDFKKISFIKRFEPYDWFIGTGLYVADVEDRIKADLLSTISRIRFGKEGYIFVNRLNGDALVSNGKLFSGKKKLWEGSNKNHEKIKDIFEKEYRAALKPDGDYIYYSWEKLTDSNIESPKTSFIYGIPDLQWLVGAGVYLDDVETDISMMRIQLNNQIKMKMIYFILIVMGIITGFILLFNWLNRGLKNDFNLFFSFFNRAAQSDEKIDRKIIKFIELDRMAEYANKMLRDRKRADDALRESEQKLATHLQNTPIGAVSWDLNFKTTQWNPAAEAIFGYSKKEALGKHVTELILPEEMAQLGDGISSNLISEKGGTRSINENITKDGRTIICDWYNTTLKNTTGKVIGMASLVSDITERKQIAEALRESEEKYRSMMETMTDQTYISSHDFRIEYMNPAMVANVGRDATGEICHRAIYNMDEICPWCVFDRVQQKEHVKSEVIDPKDNSYYSVINSPISHADGRVSRLTILRDITEIKNIEENLRQAQKMESIGTLTGGIAHDFNNILGIILGNTELALEDVPEWNPAHSNLGKIKKASLRATAIVRQLLNFSRITDQKLQSVEIVPVIKDALKFLRSTIPSTIDIHLNIQVRDETILADPTQINQIMMNLCINASHAMEQTGGNLSITVEKVSLDDISANNCPDLKKGKHIKIVVGDTGPGIAPEIIDRIFDPYFTTKGVGTGSGMGLSVVHGIVKNHGGAIIVDSEPGKGTSFSIFFPIVTEKPEKEFKIKGELPGGNEAILFVDDEESITDVIQKILERIGYRVESKLDPEEALELFKSKPEYFDLVITDMTMPQMTGAKLSEKLIEIRSDIPIIICSGHSSLMDEEKSRQLGIAAYVMKPVSMSEIAKTIRKVLDN